MALSSSHVLQTDATLVSDDGLRCRSVGHVRTLLPLQAESLGVTLLRDPNNLIRWENGADIQMYTFDAYELSACARLMPSVYAGYRRSSPAFLVEYATPDSTWDDWKAARVLTGRDFDLEGLAMKNSTYAVAVRLEPTSSPLESGNAHSAQPMMLRLVWLRALNVCCSRAHSLCPSAQGEELMVALFPIDPSTGIVLGNFVRTPDIDLNGEFNGKFLSSVADKVHCPEAGLIDNTCFAGEDFTEKTMEFADGTSKTFIRHGEGRIAQIMHECLTRLSKGSRISMSSSRIFTSISKYARDCLHAIVYRSLRTLFRSLQQFSFTSYVLFGLHDLFRTGMCPPFAAQEHGSVAAFVERTSGSVIADRGEPGDSRVYRVHPDPLQFESFYGARPGRADLRRRGHGPFMAEEKNSLLDTIQ
eukprot:5016702-Pleurochrysis_carterae.AAC.4